MRSCTRPTDRGTSVAVRSAARISTAAAAACCGWSSPSKSSSSASPPNLSSEPPRSNAISSIVPKTRFRTSVSSSTPMRPRIARRSERAVKPEMSTKHRLPSSSCQRAPGASRSHSDATRGTNRSRVWAGPGGMTKEGYVLLPERRRTSSSP